jgi:hypothetical protein
MWRGLSITYSVLQHTGVIARMPPVAWRRYEATSLRMGGCMCCLSGRSYFFLLLRSRYKKSGQASEKSSKKEKAIFGQLLRWPRKGSTLGAHRYWQLYGAGFSCLSPAAIEREFLFWLLVWHVARLQPSTAKKGTIRGWAASRLSAFFFCGLHHTGMFAHARAVALAVAQARSNLIADGWFAVVSVRLLLLFSFASLPI